MLTIDDQTLLVIIIKTGHKYTFDIPRETSPTHGKLRRNIQIKRLFTCPFYKLYLNLWNKIKINYF